MAGKCGNGSGKGGGGSTTTADSITTIEDCSALWLGGTVGFEITAVGVAGYEFSNVQRLVLPATATATASTRNQTKVETSCAPRCGPEGELTLGDGGSDRLRSGGDAECWPCSKPAAGKAASSRHACPLGRLPRGGLS